MKPVYQIGVGHPSSLGEKLKENCMLYCELENDGKKPKHFWKRTIRGGVWIPIADDEEVIQAEYRGLIGKDV